MGNEKVNEILALLLRLYDENRQHPFPYDGCRAVLKRAGREHEHLISDLDQYFSEIAGYSSWGRKILTWPKEKVEQVRKRLSRSFFQKHEDYKPLEAMITQVDTPDLYAELELYETMRNTLLALLSQLSHGPEHSGTLVK
jgi:hypothetical protein